MPLESEAQRRYLWATDPELAKKFEDETPKGAKLPERKKRKSETAVEETIELKNFSDKEREKLAKKGDAMPGGGFPIRNGGDLRNAIQGIGRAKNPGAAKAFIIKRAKELKLTDLLPADWTGSTKEELTARVEALELAVLALGQEEFGDSEGHPFRGNQWKDVSGREAAANAAADRKATDTMTPHLKRPGETDRQFESRVKASAPNLTSDFERVQRTEAAAKVGLKSFDHAGPGDPALPKAADLKGGGATTFVRSFGYPEPGKGTGLWVMQHDASGTRLEGTGTRGAVQAGIRSQYPASGTWTILP